MIDDLFCISCEALGSSSSGPQVSQSGVCRRGRVEGSDSKDILS